MPRFRFQGLEALPAALGDWLPRAITVLAEELRLEVAEQAIAELETLSPVKTGKYRASHTPAVGQVVTRKLPNLPAYPIDGIARVQEAFAGTPAASPAFIANAVESKEGDGSYAGLLEGGRREYSRVASRRSQMVGSTQAPGGVYGPTVQELRGRRATIVANAIERARARLG